MMHRSTLILIAAGLLAQQAFGAPLYVSGSGSDTANLCASSASPCRTITRAMSGAAAGDVINVADGAYDTAAGEVFPIIVKSGVQILASGTAAILDNHQTLGNRFLNILGASAVTRVEGLTFQQSFCCTDTTDKRGGAILVDSGSQVTITRNIFNSNRATQGTSIGTGGAIHVGAATPIIMNNLFISNSVAGGSAQGGAIYALGGSIVNNTFVFNSITADQLAVGGAVYADSTATVTNNIFYGNSVTAGTPAASGSLYAAPNSATNNLIFNSTIAGGAGNDTTGTNPVLADPLFHHCSSAPGCNARIAENSPAHGTGTASGAPPTDFTGVARPNPPSIGAYEPSGAYLQDMDITGDGRSDILYRNVSSGLVWRLAMNGGIITSQGGVYSEPNTAWKIVANGDFNGDGITDLLWRNDSTGQVYLTLLNSSGAVASGAFVYAEANPAWKIVAAPDLNGDGKADILYRNSSTGMVYALIMNVFTVTGQGIVYTEPNTAWKIAGVGDFNGTGKQNQMLYRNDSSGDLYVVQANFNGSSFTTTGRLLGSPGAAAKVIGVADFDGDRISDVLLRDDVTGAVHGLGTPVIYTEPNPAWKIVAVGDYNGNGKADILWQNSTSGQVFIMLMNGTTIVSSGTIYTEPNTAWHIVGPAEYAAQ